MSIKDGTVTTEPAAMADDLKDHWGAVFAHQSIDSQLLHTWLDEVFPDGGGGCTVRGLPARSSPSWRLCREDVAETVKTSSNTMPGSDKIPYAAWRALGDVAVDTLFEAGRALATTEGAGLLLEASDSLDGLHDFNTAILCCLPKKPSGTTPEVGEYYSADNTRPLAIVNTDNRLIAGAYKNRWEEIFGRWISAMQRGFLRGRSILSNIVDIDFEAMRISLREEASALVLFDFRAAFPSISHEYLLAVLTHLGLPDSALNFVKALYDQNRCRLSIQGSRYEGFEIRAGIRQGCPLSPLLFAVVVDLLLRKFATLQPEDTIRAFADDTASVLADWWKAAGGHSRSH
jgi:hypothetical protein